MTDGFDIQLKRRMKDIRRIVAMGIEANNKSVQMCADEGKRRVQDLLQTPGHYKKTAYSWGDHWSSAPGQPPALGTGHLLKSIVSAKTRDGNPASAYFGATARYAIPLEFGHKGPRPAAPRPFMRPVANDPSFRAYITMTVAQEWRRAILMGVAKTAKTSFKL